MQQHKVYLKSSLSSGIVGGSLGATEKAKFFLFFFYFLLHSRFLKTVSDTESLVPTERQMEERQRKLVCASCTRRSKEEGRMIDPFINLVQRTRKTDTGKSQTSKVSETETKISLKT